MITKRLGHFTLLPTVLLTCLLLAGCWDRVELDRRAIVLTVGIDLPVSEAVHAVESGGDAHNRPPRYMMSTEIAILRGLGQQDSGAGSLMPDLNKPAGVLIGTGRTLFAIERMLSSRMNRTIHWSHLKTIIVGESFARERGLYAIMDFLTREVHFNRRMRIGIASGDAYPFLQMAMIPDQFTGTYIADILEINTVSARAPIVHLNDIDRALHGSGNILLPRLTLGDAEIKMAGSAIIKRGKMVGWLGELETQWALFASDGVRGGSILVPDPAYPHEEILFDIKQTSTEIRLDTTGPVPVFRIDIRLEGGIVERVAYPTRLTVEDVKKIEEAVADALREGVGQVIETMQHNYQVDVFGFAEFLEKRHPAMWEQVKEGWDDVGFATTEFNVYAYVILRDTGVIE